MSVEALLGLYVPRSASAELRTAIFDLLQRKAGESSNRVLTNYLRTIADCIREFPDTSGTECSEQAAPVGEPHSNRMTHFLNSRR
ncbi:MAG: hypothetical protein ACR2IE_00830 [Candidatus Sumerlaeaceae bacterium]